VIAALGPVKTPGPSLDTAADILARQTGYGF
jgi:hypothetical protein